MTRTVRAALMFLRSEVAAAGAHRVLDFCLGERAPFSEFLSAER